MCWHKGKKEEEEEAAKKAKDCVAGAVLLAAIGSAIIGCIIFVPKLLSLATSHAA